MESIGKLIGVPRDVTKLNNRYKRLLKMTPNIYL